MSRTRRSRPSVAAALVGVALVVGSVPPAMAGDEGREADLRSAKLEYCGWDKIARGSVRVVSRSEEPLVVALEDQDGQPLVHSYFDLAPGAGTRVEIALLQSSEQVVLWQVEPIWPSSGVAQGDDTRPDGYEKVKRLATVDRPAGYDCSSMLVKTRFGPVDPDTCTADITLDNRSTGPVLLRISGAGRPREVRPLGGEQVTVRRVPLSTATLPVSGEIEAFVYAGLLGDPPWKFDTHTYDLECSGAYATGHAAGVAVPTGGGPSGSADLVVPRLPRCEAPGDEPVHVTLTAEQPGTMFATGSVSARCGVRGKVSYSVFAAMSRIGGEHESVEHATRPGDRLTLELVAGGVRVSSRTDGWVVEQPVDLGAVDQVRLLVNGDPALLAEHVRLTGVDLDGTAIGETDGVWFREVDDRGRTVLRAGADGDVLELRAPRGPGTDRRNPVDGTGV